MVGLGTGSLWEHRIAATRSLYPRRCARACGRAGGGRRAGAWGPRPRRAPTTPGPLLPPHRRRRSHLDMKLALLAFATVAADDCIGFSKGAFSGDVTTSDICRTACETAEGLCCPDFKSSTSTNGTFYKCACSSSDTSTSSTSLCEDAGYVAPCFPSDATVTLATGEVMRIDLLQPGDKILAAKADGSLYHDTVSRWSLAEHDVRSKAFVQLTTEAPATTLRVTATHHLPVGPHKALKHAADVTVGEELWLVTEGALVARRVAHVDAALADGLHNPLLQQGGMPVVVRPRGSNRRPARPKGRPGSLGAADPLPPSSRAGRRRHLLQHGGDRRARRPRGARARGRLRRHGHLPRRARGRRRHRVRGAEAALGRRGALPHLPLHRRRGRARGRGREELGLRPRRPRAQRRGGRRRRAQEVSATRRRRRGGASSSSASCRRACTLSLLRAEPRAAGEARAARGPPAHQPAISLIRGPTLACVVCAEGRRRQGAALLGVLTFKI